MDGLQGECLSLQECALIPPAELCFEMTRNVCVRFWNGHASHKLFLASANVCVVRLARTIGSLLEIFEIFKFSAVLLLSFTSETSTSVVVTMM